MGGLTPQHAPRLKVSAPSRDLLGALVPLPREGPPLPQLSRGALEQGLPPGPHPERSRPLSPGLRTRSPELPLPQGHPVTSGSAVTGGLTLELDPRPRSDQAEGQGPGAAGQEGGPHHGVPFPSCPGSRRRPVGGRQAARPGSPGPVPPRLNSPTRPSLICPLGGAASLVRFSPATVPVEDWPPPGPGLCVPSRLQDPPHCHSGEDDAAYPGGGRCWSEGEP